VTEHDSASGKDEYVDCQEAIHIIYHYLDGELTEDRRMEIQAHLDDCLPCLEAYDFEAELRMVVAKKCREEVPESLRVRIAEALRFEAKGDFGIPTV
jgi:mycothiol system anti-sigma-R factor